jgi:hypothetical protein
VGGVEMKSVFRTSIIIESKFDPRVHKSGILHAREIHALIDAAGEVDGKAEYVKLQVEEVQVVKAITVHDIE